MAAVLISMDSLICTAGNGKVQSAGDSKLLVNSNPVMTVAAVQGAAVAGCAPKGTAACTSVASMVSGIATKLLVSGSPVLLSGAAGTGAPEPHPIGPVSASHSKLVAS